MEPMVVCQILSRSNIFSKLLVITAVTRTARFSMLLLLSLGPKDSAAGKVEEKHISQGMGNSSSDSAHDQEVKNKGESFPSDAREFVDDSWSHKKIRSDEGKLEQDKLLRKLKETKLKLKRERTGEVIHDGGDDRNDDLSDSSKIASAEEFNHAEEYGDQNLGKRKLVHVTKHLKHSGKLEAHAHKLAKGVHGDTAAKHNASESEDASSQKKMKKQHNTNMVRGHAKKLAKGARGDAIAKHDVSDSDSQYEDASSSRKKKKKQRRTNNQSAHNNELSKATYAIIDDEHNFSDRDSDSLHEDEIIADKNNFSDSDSDGLHEDTIIADKDDFSDSDSDSPHEHTIIADEGDSSESESDGLHEDAIIVDEDNFSESESDSLHEDAIIANKDNSNESIGDSLHEDANIAVEDNLSESDSDSLHDDANIAHEDNFSDSDSDSLRQDAPAVEEEKEIQRLKKKLQQLKKKHKLSTSDNNLDSTGAMTTSSSKKNKLKNEQRDEATEGGITTATKGRRRKRKLKKHATTSTSTTLTATTTTTFTTTSTTVTTTIKTTTAEMSDLHATKAKHKKKHKSKKENKGSIGDEASLDEIGYQSVVRHCCPDEMTRFFKRVIANEGMDVCNEGGLSGTVIWFDCADDKQTYDVLLQELYKGTEGPCSFLRKGPDCLPRQDDCGDFPNASLPDCGEAENDYASPNDASLNYIHMEESGACSIEGPLEHERCHCKDRDASFCKDLCDEDPDCKGYTSAPNDGCDVATTGTCSDTCRKINSGNVGDLVIPGRWSSGKTAMNYGGCWKKIEN
eukprot:CAMPEP_0169302532 /NCGR_PEP_ID=MMETSP1016-20121227/68850_1 /TAXON_ID=342587 /ORGANISM="Karlodinium micrum, Strain CCMP2283" /LENGTH=794 /DNA_ID=CAMNT_0009395249 /DNA_START=157 /DNA_END=2541 /DNA_ORIENTATION=+